jgi:quinol monooxygenase YgiN
MTKPGVYFIVDLTIVEGRVDEFQAIAEEMVAGTQTEPGALGYEFYLDADRRQGRLIEIYSDSDAALAHCKGRVVQELVPKLLSVSSLAGFSVYGDLSAEAADVLTQGGAKLFQQWRGFNRFQGTSID